MAQKTWVRGLHRARRSVESGGHGTVRWRAVAAAALPGMMSVAERTAIAAQLREEADALDLSPAPKKTGKVSFGAVWPWGRCSVARGLHVGCTLLLCLYTQVANVAQKPSCGELSA